MGGKGDTWTRLCAQTHKNCTRKQKGFSHASPFCMWLEQWLTQMQHTADSHPSKFCLFGGLFLRPPWNMEAAERLALDNQLWRGWKIQFISPLLLVKQPLEQEMTEDVLIFKRWAPRSLRLDGRIYSNVTELTAQYTNSSVFFPYVYK